VSSRSDVGTPPAAGSRADFAVLKLVVGYDGTGFLGSQRQARGRTIQQELEIALSRLGGKPVTTEFAGRTDRGVHAVGQVVRADDIRPELTEESIGRALNQVLPADLAVSAVSRVDPGFHPRYDATWREYRYRIWVGGKQPLAGRFSWTRRSGLDVDAMALAAASLEGTRDLAAFTGGGEGVPWSDRAKTRRGTVRNVLQCSARVAPPWWGVVPGSGEGIEVRMIADGFLPQVVRTVVGGLVAVGSGERSPEWFSELLHIADRRMGPVLAPAHGLIFWRVGYGNDVPDPDPDRGLMVSPASPHTQHR
jgi:tRNA pseudouridine38-40 synthase